LKDASVADPENPEHKISIVPIREFPPTFVMATKLLEKMLENPTMFCS
jgi:hypothetical protein